ncbi:metallophosphatase domain-containing protein [Bacteroides ihuae]|uniref:metallophosphatase domain-containing protein n=1 Tax=Bacteroides ihuae TaxID=1852362 RepID=UPI0008D99084|nr:metallophosphatase domain-containing protein [Bacteroides ihuae]
MKILFISDTHGQHRKLRNLPEADMLIHGGDVSKRGEDHEIEDFIRWFSQLDFQYKIFIAGNHDFYFEDETVNRIQKMLPQNTYYLCDTGVIIEGLNFWGSPISPTFFNWAFNRDRGKEIAKYWNKIPENTDILITHGPPFGVLDLTQSGLHVGCEDLLKKVKSIKLQYHLFGHIHEAYGVYESAQTTFINGSILDENYVITNQPIVFNL